MTGKLKQDPVSGIARTDPCRVLLISMGPTYGFRDLHHSFPTQHLTKFLTLKVRDFKARRAIYSDLGII